MISTFPSTTMPRELYAIKYTTQAGRSGTDEEGRKVAAGVKSKGYSNALSSGCRGKLETIRAYPWRKAKIGSTKEMVREERRKTGFLRDGSTSEKHYTLFMSFVPTHVLF